MAKVETITLVRPIEVFNKQVKELRLKEPTGAQYIKIGEPRIVVRTAAGGGYYVEQTEEIKAYLDVCVDHELQSEILSLLSLTDAMEVKKTLLNFFESAEATRIARRLTNSSSGSGS